ncbi:hypothetical protein GYMLUDRAFT_84300 [Collybiopsis luxurians FD-317 M1]|uniref:Arrestin-like N-terminal domain-containing protein n=1 Tax=Collybiopsis luxurians FD-317 M1 TaxID=944289 RepID=A0A0D0CJD5_9AGAR|nr:hypothetical protein GYMLUDRAFT_84300 [Collybiopsis luxurians FD-317 M1]
MQFEQSSRSSPSPRYSTLSTAPPRYSVVLDEYPSTDSHYLFPLKNSKGKIWASVNLQKENLQRVNNVPVFLEGASPISGSVTLDLESPETIQSIAIAIRGRAITGANEGGSHTFLDRALSLWSKDQGEPNAFRSARSPGNQPLFSPAVNTSSSPRSGKLSGAYSFPFSIAVPIDDAAGGSLPETFSERSSLVRVRYELVLKIGRGRFKADSKLQVPFIFRRKAIPPDPSDLRKIAYLEHTMAPGPEIDPYGWVTLSTVDCVGRLLNSRTVVLRCTLSLANPLSYTRGSFISCHLRIESVDEQALDLLASPRNTILRLYRRIRYLYDAGQGMQENGISIASKQKYEIFDIGLAVWIHDPASQDENESRVRCLMGEIHLPKDLPPSSNVMPFGIEYSVILGAFESATFRPSENSSASLHTQKVEIVTEFAQGVVPFSSISPDEAAWAHMNERNESALDAPHKNPFQLIV